MKLLVFLLAYFVACLLIGPPVFAYGAKVGSQYSIPVQCLCSEQVLCPKTPLSDALWMHPGQSFGEALLRRAIVKLVFVVH